MRIFVAYGYNDRDLWIEKVVFPVIEAFGSECVHGRALQGQEIRPSVQKLIESCDAAIGFSTARANETAGVTHRWVTDELATALNRMKYILEVREEGVSEQEGMLVGRQHVKYSEKDPARCVVEIIQALGAWHRGLTRRFQLTFPAGSFKPLKGDDYECTYRILDTQVPSAEGSTTVLPIEDAYFVEIEGLAPTSKVQVEVPTKVGMLFSPYTPIDAIVIRLQQR